MSLITIMNGVPLYTTKQEALRWALSNNVRGYHTHKYRGKKGYMGGATHSIVTKTSSTNQIASTQQITRPPTQINQQRTIEPTRAETPQQTRPQQIQQRTEPTRRTITRTSSRGGY